MALTKAQISQVTVAALGVAPGGYEAQLAAFNTQDELAAFLASANLLGADKTNAEFALEIGGNVGLSAGDAAVTKLFEALESGTSRAEAVVDFANAQQVAGNATLSAAVEKAVAYTGTSTDLAELKAAVAADAAADDSMTITFSDDDGDQDTSTATENETVYNIGKAQLDAGQSKVSADYTFELKDQIDESDDFNGLFLSPILERQAAESSGSQLFLELLDLRADEDNKDPLERVPVDTFAFSLDGSQILVQSDAIFAANTYAELFAAIEARITELGNGVNVPTTNSDGSPADAAAYAKLSGFTVELGNQFTVTNQSGDDVSGTQIVLTDAGGATLTPQGFVNKAGVIPDPGYTLYAQLDNVPPTTVTKLITTNLEADNVGYGSQGASVNLAGQSASDKGVEEIKVTANNGVWFTTLSSKATTNHLERVELQTGSDSYFRVGTQKNDANHLVALVDEDFDNAGLVDVQQVAAGAAESVAINSYITEAVLNRYELEDTAIYTADDSQAEIDYSLTSGNDVLQLKIDTEVVAYADTDVAITTGAGNDFVHLQLDNGNNYGSTWLTNQQENDNIDISSASGNNTIWTEGAGNVSITTGSGADTIYADDSGLQTITHAAGTASAMEKLVDMGVSYTDMGSGVLDAGDTIGLNGLFVLNSANVDVADLISSSDDALGAGADADPQVFNTFKNKVQISFLGFESELIEVAYDKSEYTTSTQQINQAIKKAINTDATLSKLIVAKEFPGNVLVVESLIDGVRIDGDLGIDFTLPDDTGTGTAGNLELTAAELTAADEAWDQAAATTTDNTGLVDLDTLVGNTGEQYAVNDFAEINAVDVVGAASGAESDNVINVQAGNDVVVLGTGTESNDTVVLTGSFGNNDIVNFDSVAANAGSDLLDFTSYLVDTSPNAAAETVTLADDRAGPLPGAVADDEITILSFSDLEVGTANGIDNTETNLSNVTAAQLEVEFANGGAITGDAGAISQHVFLIENDSTLGGANAGEYLVVTGTTGSADGALDLTIVGTLDFGANLDASFAGVAQFA